MLGPFLDMLFLLLAVILSERHAPVTPFPYGPEICLKNAEYC